jgi:hypothetical protein
MRAVNQVTTIAQLFGCVNGTVGLAMRHLIIELRLIGSTSQVRRTLRVRRSASSRTARTGNNRLLHSAKQPICCCHQRLSLLEESCQT